MKYFIFVILSIAWINSFAQNDIDKGNKTPFKERLYFSISPQLAIGNSFTQIGVSPSVGYMFTPRFSVGIGGTYIYEKFFDRKSDLYGARVFSRYNITDKIFAYTEYQSLTISSGSEKANLRNSVYAGGGYFERISAKAGFQIIALYNLGTTIVGQSPWVVRAGITYSPF